MKTIYSLACILLSLLLIPTSSSAAKLGNNLSVRNLCRSRSNGFRALLPGSCSQYYECQNGRTRVSTCPAYYDLVNGKCVDTNPGCIEGMRSVSSCTGPCCGIANGYAVNRDNQQIYYQCKDDNVVSTLTCAGDQQFNLVKSLCDIPGICLSCSGSVTTVTPPCTTTTTPCTTTTTCTEPTTPTTTCSTPVVTTPTTTCTSTTSTTTTCSTTTTSSTTTTTCTTPTTTTPTTTTTTTCTTPTTTTPTTTTTCTTPTTSSSTTTTTCTTPTTTSSTTTTTCTTPTTTSPTTTTTCTTTPTTKSTSPTTTTCSTTTSTTTTCTTTTCVSIPTTPTTTCTTTQTPCVSTIEPPCDTAVIPASSTGLVKPPQTLQTNIDLYIRYVCRDKPNNFMLASLKSCNQYYICQNGLAIPVSCGNKYFNALKGICDLPQNSGCIQPQGYRNIH